MTTMRRPTWEIFSDLAKTVPVKHLAYILRLDPSLIYRYCKEPLEVEDVVDGRRNMIDRTCDLLRVAVTNGRPDLALEIINYQAVEIHGVIVLDDQLTAIEGLVETVRKQSQPPKAGREHQFSLVGRKGR